MIAVGPATLVHIGIDTVTWRRSGEHIGNKTFIPASYFIVHAPVVVAAPVPEQEAEATTCIPVPLHIIPHPGDMLAQKCFLWCGLIKIFTRTQQTLKQVRCLHQVAAIVFRTEWHR